MRPADGRRLLSCLVSGALCLVAQSGASRDAYRAAYKSWREADTGLERDAGTAGEAMGSRTARAADAAAAYGSARIAFLRDLSDRHAENLKWLRDTEVQPVPDLSPAPALIAFTSREINAASTSASAFANNPDRAIQQLRQAFERERAALEALRTAVTNRQRAEEKTAKAALAAEQARGKALEQYPFLASALAQSEGLMQQEATAWAAYYPALAEASRLPAPPVSSPPAISEQSPNLQNQAGHAIASAAPAAPRAPSIALLPLSRYVGIWDYQRGGLFHGSEPEFVDLAVHEENGQATGTFYARFKVPPGSKGDPVLRFTFSGDFRATRDQTFPLETSDGAKGTIDIIPGGPFNVLEVNFTIEAKAGKVRQGDVILVKQ